MGPLGVAAPTRVRTSEDTTVQVCGLKDVEAKVSIGKLLHRLCELPFFLILEDVLGGLKSVWQCM